VTDGDTLNVCLGLKAAAPAVRLVALFATVFTAAAVAAAAADGVAMVELREEEKCRYAEMNGIDRVGEVGV